MPRPAYWMITGLSAALAALAGVSTAAEPAPALIERLLKANRRIETVRCDIRREVDAGETVSTVLSRVWYARKDRLHVNTVRPVPRHIVVDGTSIYKWIDGQQTGVCIPLATAPPSELLQVRRVPASGEEYLLRLRGTREIVLPATAGFPTRRRYEPAPPHPYATVALDKLNRLSRIEFYDRDDPTRRVSRVDFANWKEVLPGIWIACTQMTETRLKNGAAVLETVRISNLAVNTPAETRRFKVKEWSGDVRFVGQDAMRRILEGDIRK